MDALVAVVEVVPPVVFVPDWTVAVPTITGFGPAVGGVDVGITALKMLATFPAAGANSTNCFVNSPGEQPGTSSSSATLVKSRSLNGKYSHGVRQAIERPLLVLVGPA